ncbi:MAG: hypothetical protein M1412_06520 [Deltaproteobacteria bacterium]|nr:hypothetical protein [Deltaproteobacteria bacterium]MCL5892798.1 hypothetical protein [Deltaproteobacteria bacterium]
MAILNWTGNPLVDTGLAVAVVKANRKSPEEMTVEDFKNVIGDGKWLTHANEHLNSYVCLFANGFLNRQVKPKDKPAQRIKYEKIIAALLEDFKSSFSISVDSINYCECTGIFPSANKTLERLSEQFRKDGILKKGQRLDIGRNAFPLIGSITNDAGALPAASREPQLSAFALLCVQMASLAAIMLKGKIAFFQYTEPNLLVSHVKQLYDEITAKLDIINSKGGAAITAIGTGKGSRSTALMLLDEFDRLKRDAKDALEIEELPEYISLNLWLVINSGTSVDCEVIEIPNAALKFIWKTATIFPDEIRGILRTEKRKSILDCIENKEEYEPFYPHPKTKPIPADLFFKAKNLLSSDNQRKAEVIDKTEHDEFENLTKSNIVTAEDKKKKKTNEKQPQNYTKKERSKTIIELLNDEFKRNKKNEIKNIIDQMDEVTSKPASKPLFALYQTNILGRSEIALSVAEWIAYNLKERLKNDKKQLELFIQKLGDLKDINKCRPKLKEIFTEFAEKGILSYEQYAALFPITGNKPIRVDNFGWRFIWFYLNHENLNSNPPKNMEGKDMVIDNRFQRKIKDFAKDVFDWYVEKNGEDKFKRKILDGFKNDKIGNFVLQDWFCNLAEITGKEGYTLDSWDDLCRDENGINNTYELRFQLRLELTNLYRQHISR